MSLGGYFIQHSKQSEHSKTLVDIAVSSCDQAKNIPSLGIFLAWSQEDTAVLSNVLECSYQTYCGHVLFRTFFKHNCFIIAPTILGEKMKTVFISSKNSTLPEHFLRSTLGMSIYNSSTFQLYNN